MKNQNFLYIIWQNPKTKKSYTVGKLTKEDDGFSFEYCNDYASAREAGWDLIQAFPKIQRYESKKLFSVFASRLPDKKRKNIKEILNKYGLTSYNGYELLRRSGGKLPIDTFEFKEPVLIETR